jgi:hypothetical protein
VSLLRIKTALILLLFAVGGCRAETSNMEQCRALFASPGFDCGCVVEFMQPRFNPIEREIILKFWAVSADAGGRRDDVLDELYRRLGSRAITDALFLFNLVRVQLFTACPASQPGPDYGF